MSRRHGFLLFVSGLLLFAGCQSTFQRDEAYGRRAAPSRKTQNAVARNVSFSDSLRPVPGNTGANIEAKFACDVQRPADATLANLADKCLAEAYRHARGEDRKDVATTGVQSVRDAFFDDYREWLADEWCDVTNGNVAAHVACWDCRVEGRVGHCDKTHFSYRVTIDTYCGGAHPNRWVQNATYSRQDGRRLTVADIIRPESMTAVVNLIRKAVRKESRGDETLDEQLAREVREPYGEYVRRVGNEWGNPLVTENFMLTKDGIVWTYNQYEIACYASGWFDALVSWDALRPHLRR